MSDIVEQFRAKVLHGLSSCGNDYGTPNICEVTECPYREIEVSCVHSLAHDAMMLISELLKEQQPRVMTLEEVRLLGKDVVVWYEYKGAFRPRPRVVKFVLDGHITFTDSGIWSFSADGYGERWRLWTSCPSDEQREAEAWN